MKKIVEIKNVRFGYTEDQLVLKDIDASIYEGQLISLLGPNGVGKSTLLNCIIGLLKPQNGEVLLDGEGIQILSRKAIAHDIAYVPQTASVPFDYSVLEYVVMGRTSQLHVWETPSTDDYINAEDALEKLEILHLKNRSITELSGGEQQKVCIARSIAQSPRLIIMDEPTSALDYGNQVKVLHLIKQLSALGYAILLTTHNPEHPILLNSDVWILDKSGKLECGSAEKMITETKLTALYDTKIKIFFSKELGRRICNVPLLEDCRGDSVK